MAPRALRPGARGKPSSSPPRRSKRKSTQASTISSLNGSGSPKRTRHVLTEEEDEQIMKMGIDHFNHILMSRVFMGWREAARSSKQQLASATLLSASPRGSENGDGNEGLHSDDNGLTGLRNVGNTCFMNSVLQVLCNTVILRDFLLVTLDLFEREDNEAELRVMSSAERVKRRRQEKEAQKKQPDRPVLKRMDTTQLLQAVAKRHKLSEKETVFVVVELQHLLRVLLSRRVPVLTPYALLSAVWFAVPRFRGYQQQDAQEFLVYLLNSIHSELETLGASQSQQNAIQHMFQGELTTRVTCSRCRHQSCTTEPFKDLSLDIPVKPGSDDSATLVSLANGRTIEQQGKTGDTVHLFASPPRVRKNNGNGPSNSVTKHVFGPPVSLSECLDSFTKNEHMAANELYDCHSCQSKQSARKKITISALPDVLILHLKRFRWTSAVRSKIDTHVAFPIDALDMAPYCTRDLVTADDAACLYTLYGVVPHHGTGWGSGHYTSYSLNPDDGRWYHYNDSSVSPASMREVHESQAYLLFYQRIQVGE